MMQKRLIVQRLKVQKRKIFHIKNTYISYETHTHPFARCNRNTKKEMITPREGVTVSATVKNLPIKKISFLPVTRGGVQLMSAAKMIYGVRWERCRL